MRKSNRRKRVQAVRRTLVYLLVRVTVAVFRAMPRRLAIAIGEVLGWAAPFLARKERRLSRKHLGIAFDGSKPPEELDRLSREMFRFLVLNFIDTIRLKAMSASQIRRTVVPHDMVRVRDAISRGPAIFLTSHTGCWELLGAYLAIEGIPLDVVARRMYDERLERLLIDSRESAGMGNISRGSGTRDIIRSLNAGRGIGFLIDQDIKNVKGVFVDFFGTPAHTATAPAQLALKRGIPIIPILTYRDDNHCHHACIGEPLEIEMTGDYDRDTLALTAACSAATEAFIREHPEQWVWFHERWKTRPPKEKT